jgi:colanic acid/amylovoran biosynthesis glycosyltransferase
MKTIGVYRTTYPLPSETFITEQVRSIVRYQPFMIVRTRIAEHPFAGTALSDHDFFRIRQSFFTFTRCWRVFSPLPRLDLIHAHFGPDGIYALPLTEKLKIPLIVTFHGSDAAIARSALERHELFTFRKFAHLEADLKKGATLVLAVSDFVRRQLLSLGYPPERVVRHYIGVDTRKFTPGASAQDFRYILSVGRHIEEKGIDLAVKAFAQIAKRHSEVQFVHIGNGPKKQDTIHLTEKLGISHRVHFLGALPHMVVRNWMQGADAFVLPSRTGTSGIREAFGMVYVEAAACGVPAIGTRVGGIPEAISHGESGLLCEENDLESLARGLDMILSNRDVAARMGRWGRERVCDLFNLECQTYHLERIYDQVAAST